jgi:hypothetical protein
MASEWAEEADRQAHAITRDLIEVGRKKGFRVEYQKREARFALGRGQPSFTSRPTTTKARRGWTGCASGSTSSHESGTARGGMKGAAMRPRPPRDGRHARGGTAATLRPRRHPHLKLVDERHDRKLRPPRIFAFILDNPLATVAAFLAVAALKTDRPYVVGGALCMSYLSYFFLCEALWSHTPGKYL